jgi:DNA modification methylase
MNPIKKEVIIGDCRLILGDCMEVMPTLGKVDAVLADPPYGIGEGGDKNRSRGKLAPVGNYKSDKWDSQINQKAIDYAISIASASIVFGGNYYTLPPTKCWLVWDKENGSNDFADCELAWTNLSKAVRRIKWLWNGMIRKGDDIRQHPTQKPVGVMEWCINHLPKGTDTILDPFMGSGTTLVACAKMGRSGIGIELDPDYFEIACERVRKAYAQADMFVAAPSNSIQPTQEGFDL